MEQLREVACVDADMMVLSTLSVEPDRLCGLCHTPDKDVIEFKGTYVCGDCIKYIRNYC